MKILRKSYKFIRSYNPPFCGFAHITDVFKAGTTTFDWQKKCSWDYIYKISLEISPAQIRPFAVYLFHRKKTNQPTYVPRMGV